MFPDVADSILKVALHVEDLPDDIIWPDSSSGKLSAT